MGQSTGQPTGQPTVFDYQLGGFGTRISQRSKSIIVMYGKRRGLKAICK